MKSSSQIIMLAILMGLFAWMADALISWQFAVGQPFSDFLISFDPEKTLYVRSVVVMLFFIFGLVTGNLMMQLEELHRREVRHVQLLEGMQAVHRLLVQVNDSGDLAEQVEQVLRDRFHLDHVRIQLISPQSADDPIPEEVLAVLEQDVISLNWKDHFPNPVRNADPRIHMFDSSTEKNRRCLCGVLCFQDRVFGLFFATCPATVTHGSEFLEPLRTLFDDLAHSMARIHDQDQVSEHARKLNDLYENAPVGIFASTVKGKLLFLNRTMAACLGGESVEEVMNQVESVEQFYLNPEARKEFLASLNRDEGVTKVENRLLGIDGKERLLIFAARLSGRFVDGDEIIEGFVMDDTESSEIRKRNRILESGLAETRHYESIAGLAAGVAHEFNNILQAMMGSAFLVQMGEEKNSTTWTYLQEIQDSGARAARLCDQMLTYAGKKAVMLREEKMDEVMAAFRVMFKSGLPDGVGLRMTLDAPGTVARIDRASFSEGVQALVHNAAESYESRGGEIHLTTELDHFTPAVCERYNLPMKNTEDLYWMLRVRDEGVGMSEETRGRIFDPFFSTKFQGRGLGLAAARGVVEKFDGALGVWSEEGKGSEFLLALPVSMSAEVEEEKPDPLAEGSEIHSEGVVWIVDDEPLICDTMSRFVTRWGLQCDTETDSTQAVMRIKAAGEQVACLVLDVTMPVMDGMEVLTELRKTLPDLPVLLMSGFDEQEMLKRFENHDVAGFIHKPFQADVLFNRLRDVLEADSSSS